MERHYISRLAKTRIFGKSPAGVLLRINKWIWCHLPNYAMNSRFGNWYGIFINGLVRLSSDRRVFRDTMFFRNRPELEMIRRIFEKKQPGSVLKITVFGCSNGAEVYSILWTLRSANTDRRIEMHGLDISNEILKIAYKGEYSLQNPELMDISIFTRMTDEEMDRMFEKDGGKIRIMEWLKEGITWHHGDAGDPEIHRLLGPQDIVVANNFLCHLDQPVAESCLRNIAMLIAPGGYLFVSGVDINIRMKVSREMGLIPQEELIREIHEGDPSLRNDWPFSYWGLEPMNVRRKNRTLRYAAVFRSRSPEMDFQ